MRPVEALVGCAGEDAQDTTLCREQVHKGHLRDGNPSSAEAELLIIICAAHNGAAPDEHVDYDGPVGEDY